MPARVFHILDAELNQVGPDVPAELYLTEQGLTSCHFSSAAAAAERFVADPFAGPGRRMYRTGALVRPTGMACSARSSQPEPPAMPAAWRRSG